MTQVDTSSTTSVSVGFAGGRKGPYKEDLPNATSLATVRQNAMNHFEVSDSTDAAGNRIVYTLVHGDDKVDLSKTVGDVAEGHPHLQMRIVREVIAG